MKTIRIISLILSICLIVSALSACSLFGGAKLPSKLRKDGTFPFKVIRSTNATDREEALAKTLRNTMRDNFVCKVDIGKDETTEYNEDAYEILIGNTNRPESTEAKSVLAASRENTAYDFIVKVIGRKVCIQAINDEMITIAGNWFSETFCDSIEDWSLLTTDYEFIYSKKFDVVNNQVAGTDLGAYTVVKPLYSDYISIMEIEDHIKFYENYGYKITYNDDVDAETTYEILLGNCDREASKNVTVEGDNYVIKVVGTKIVIKGGSSLATFRAIRHFNDLVKAAKDGGETINWNDGYVINGKYDATEPGTYTLNWADEFGGSKIDLSIWNNYTGVNRGASILGGKVYTPEPDGSGLPEGVTAPGKLCYITDGKLAFENYRVGKDFFSFEITSRDALCWRYGVAEISMQAPEEPIGISLWFNKNVSKLKMGGGKTINVGSDEVFTEVDLIENYGHPNRFSANVHRWWREPTLDGLVNSLAHNIALDESFLKEGSSSDFTVPEEKYGANGMADKTQHVYTWYWDNHKMKFAFDGRTWCTYDYTTTNSAAIHSLLTSFILAGNYGYTTYGTAFKEGIHPDYSVAYFDYCRVYQTDALNSQLIQSYTSEEYERPAIIVYPNNPIVGDY